ncbi:hypothetical protein B0H13DRAFT_1019244 [Mycena leptocephala]|nr:hypothetical protein B0H13DRAFT_1019244 [Mycena leptocephala]
MCEPPSKLHGLHRIYSPRFARFIAAVLTSVYTSRMQLPMCESTQDPMPPSSILQIDPLSSHHPAPHDTQKPRHSPPSPIRSPSPAHAHDERLHPAHPPAHRRRHHLCPSATPPTRCPLLPSRSSAAPPHNRRADPGRQAPRLPHPARLPFKRGVLQPHHRPRRAENSAPLLAACA